MIREAIEKIEELSTSTRDAVLELPDGSRRIFLYDDAQQQYSELQRVVIQSGKVSNIESFAALVLEEAKRRGEALNAHDGSWMTVVFNTTGGRFAPNDEVRLDEFLYKRTLSPQWLALTTVLNQPMEHKTFVAAMQRLRPSILEYSDLIRQFRKVSFSDKTNIVSEPMLSAGANDNSYQVQIGVMGGGGTSATAFPSEFEVELQYARGSEKRYRTPIEIDMTTVTRGDRKELRFTLVAPDLPNVEERAIEDEIAYFREMVKDLPRLLVLVDF